MGDKMISHDKIIETDLLIIGGGVAGCCAAIKASEDIDVVMLDKAAIIRSGGCGPGGPDHLSTVMREGVTALEFIKGIRERGFPPTAPNIEPKSGLMDENLNYVDVDNVMWAIEELEKIGCNLRWDDGEYNWIPWYATPGKKTGLRIHGHNFKPQLAAPLRKKKNVKTLERIMAVDLLTKENRVVGATAFNIRTGEFVLCKAKMTILGTGMCERIYEPEAGAAPKYKMVYCLFPGSGDGIAMAYRAGAGLVNMEFPYSTLHGLDFLTMHYGHLTHAGVSAKVFDAKGDFVCDMPIKYTNYLELEKKGLTPVYYSVEHLSEEDHNIREIGNADMIPMFFKYAEERGFDPRNHRFSVMSAKPVGLSGSYPGLAGVLVDEESRTSLEGLFAAGDMIGGLHFRGVPPAAIFGFRLGMEAAEIIHNTEKPVIDEAQVLEQKDIVYAPLRVKDGVEPMEYESKIRAICEKYGGRIMTDGKLIEGLSRLSDVRNDWLPRIKARNPHELMKAHESRNLLDIAEVHLCSALERKESRHYFYRQDYPEKDPKYDEKAIIVHRSKGKMVFTLKTMPKLKRKYEEKGE